MNHTGNVVTSFDELSRRANRNVMNAEAMPTILMITAPIHSGFPSNVNLHSRNIPIQSTTDAKRHAAAATPDAMQHVLRQTLPAG